MNVVTLIGNVQSIEAWREGARVELLVTEPDGTTGTYPVVAFGRTAERILGSGPWPARIAVDGKLRRDDGEIVVLVETLTWLQVNDDTRPEAPCLMTESQLVKAWAP